MGFSTRRQRQQVRTPQPTDQATRSLFRRSRTLTGSISSRVASVVEKRSQLKSPRLKSHNLHSHRRQLMAGLLILMSLSVATVWLLDQWVVRPSIVFQPSIVSGSSDIEVKYRHLIDEYFQLFPLDRFEFVLNDDRFSRYITEAAPELVSAVLTNTKGLSSHQVSLGARTPLARWQLGDKHYFVDAGGVSFESNLLATPSLSVKDESGLPIASQQIIASTKMMRFIGQVVGGITAQAGIVQQVVIPPATLKEVDVILENRPYPIRLNIDRDAAGQVTDIVNTLRYIDRVSLTPRYLDVRVEGKAFYQ